MAFLNPIRTLGLQSKVQVRVHQLATAPLVNVVGYSMPKPVDYSCACAILAVQKGVIRKT